MAVRGDPLDSWGRLGLFKKKFLTQNFEKIITCSDFSRKKITEHPILAPLTRMLNLKKHPYTIFLWNKITFLIFDGKK